MNKAQIVGLKNALSLMQLEVDGGHTPTAGDRLFHTRIAEAAENSVLQRVVCELFDERHNPLFEQLGNHFETVRSWTIAIAEHQAIVDAIASHAPEAARAAMNTHLINSHDRFTANWPAKTAAADTPTPPGKTARRKAA
jgi:DNA-binding FadR family transcriptional regulator